MLIKVLIALVVCKTVDGLMCYQCQDTSNEDGKNRCQTYVRTMRYYRKQFEQTGTIIPEKYVKDCSDFASGLTTRNGIPGRVYCSIASVESQGRVRSFIRGCSDGQTFFQSDYNDRFTRVIPDNQTSCVYSGIGYLACVTMCDTDFCNGPSSATLLQPNMIILALLSILLQQFL